MRVNLRPLVAALSIAIATPLALVGGTAGAFAQDQQAAPPQEPVKQMAIIDKQVEQVLAAKKELDGILDKLPEGAASDQPDPKVVAQLDGVAKKYKFAGYAEYDDVTNNIGLVMAGVDPQTKKYVGTEAMIKKQMAEIQADKKLPAKDKKDVLDQMTAALKSVTPLQFPANVQVVTKYYDKLVAAMPQD